MTYGNEQAEARRLNRILQGEAAMTPTQFREFKDRLRLLADKDHTERVWRAEMPSWDRESFQLGYAVGLRDVANLLTDILVERRET